jgi:hypothetical protein
MPLGFFVDYAVPSKDTIWSVLFQLRFQLAITIQYSHSHLRSTIWAEPSEEYPLVLTVTVTELYLLVYHLTTASLR